MHFTERLLLDTETMSLIVLLKLVYKSVSCFHTKFISQVGLFFRNTCSIRVAVTYITLNDSLRQTIKTFLIWYYIQNSPTLDMRQIADTRGRVL